MVQSLPGEVLKAPVEVFESSNALLDGVKEGSSEFIDRVRDAVVRERRHVGVEKVGVEEVTTMHLLIELSSCGVSINCISAL